eukprot:1162119-Pelagomonas_calceolata.AAC.1
MARNSKGTAKGGKHWLHLAVETHPTLIQQKGGRKHPNSGAQQAGILNNFDIQSIGSATLTNQRTYAHTYTHNANTHTYTHIRRHSYTHGVHLKAWRAGGHCALSAAEGLHMDGQPLSSVRVGALWMLWTYKKGMEHMSTRVQKIHESMEHRSIRGQGTHEHEQACLIKECTLPKIKGSFMSTSIQITRMMMMMMIMIHMDVFGGQEGGSRGASQQDPCLAEQSLAAEQSLQKPYHLLPRDAQNGSKSLCTFICINLLGQKNPGLIGEMMTSKEMGRRNGANPNIQLRSANMSPTGAEAMTNTRAAMRVISQGRP